jgi:HPt (histidine-containing phosphotransfer) domain-containing protein
LIGLFLGECPNLLAEVRSAVAANDGNRLRIAAHVLKGSVSNFDAAEAYEAASRLEEVSRGKDCAETETTLATLENTIAELQAALANLRPVARVASQM